MEGEINEKLLEIGVAKGGEEENLQNKIWSETKKIWIIAGPAILMRTSMFGINVISQAFIGHIGGVELAAYALVCTVIFRFANSILLGMTSGMETLCGQAYGAKQYHMLGIYLQQSWIVSTAASVLLLPLFIFTTPILKALGQDENIAEMAGTIGLWYIPVLFALVVSFTCQMYLQAQSKNLVISFLAVLSVLIHVFSSWLLTVKYEFGLPGAMVSTILAFWILNAGQIIYITSGHCRETWRGFTTLAFKDLGPMIKLSISSGAMICLELWYNTILILLTGNMENAEVTINALSICLNISGWALMISMGFLIAACVRVSNELGRGDPKAVKLSIFIVMLTSSSIGVLLFAFFLICRGNLAYVFSKSSDVVNAVAHLSPLLAFTLLLNGIQPVLSGVASGAGKQRTVAYVNLSSYYLIGIPLGVILGYVVKLQVEGVWIGMTIGTVVQTAILVIMTYRTDWDQEVDVARRRIGRRSVEAETSKNDLGVA